MRTAPTLTITRADLVALIDDAATGCAESTRTKLRAVAETTEAVAAGWWHCDGVSCPSRQARRKNQTFQERYDRAMAERFGRDLFQSFVVRVEPPS